MSADRSSVEQGVASDESGGGHGEFASSDSPANGQQATTATRCRCGETLGGRYGRERLCWPCFMEATGVKPLPAYTRQANPSWVIFRKRILDPLVRVDRERFMYLDRDSFAAGCPVCASGFVVVRFHGKAERADIACSTGCDEQAIVEAIRGGRRTAAT